MMFFKVPKKSRVTTSFFQGFLKGAKETPRMYFAPLFALWKFFEIHLALARSENQIFINQIFPREKQMTF